MSRDDAKKVIEDLSKKYFRQEVLGMLRNENDYSDDPLFWNVFAYKGFTKDEYYMLGLALTEIANG